MGRSLPRFLCLLPNTPATPLPFRRTGPCWLSSRATILPSMSSILEGGTGQEIQEELCQTDQSHRSEWVHPFHGNSRSYSGDDQVCSAAHRRSPPVCYFYKFFSHRVIRRLAGEESKSVMGLGPLPSGISTGLPICVERKFAHPLRGFFGMFFCKQRLIQIAALDRNAEKESAFAIEHLTEIVCFVISPGFKGCPNQQGVVARLDPF